MAKLNWVAQIVAIIAPFMVYDGRLSLIAGRLQFGAETGPSAEKALGLNFLNGVGA